jgi:hypothetical protein
VIEIVEVSSGAGCTYQELQYHAVADLKKQSAKIGANGVLLTIAETQTPAMTGFTIRFWFYPPTGIVLT